MFDHRLQILIDDPHYQKLSSLAGLQGLSMAAVIRRAIDELPDPDVDWRRRALAHFLESPPIPLPEDRADLRGDRNEAHDRLPR